MKIKECKFFALGTCARGADCTYSHDKPTTKLRADARNFQPSQNLHTFSAEAISLRADPPRTPCRYFISGTCKRGDYCLYEHAAVPGPNFEPRRPQAFIQQSKASDHQTPLDPAPFPSAANATHSTTPLAHVINEGTATSLGESRSINGMNAKFGPGAKVSTLDFASEYSAARVSGLPFDCGLERVPEILAALGQPVPLSCIQKKASSEPRDAVFVVKVKDRRYAQSLVSSVNQGLETINLPKIDVSLVQLNNASEASTNRLQMNSVICSWYKPSRVAWLHYEKLGTARAAEQWIQKHSVTVSGRKLQPKLQVPRDRFGGYNATIYSVQLGNVDATATEAMIERRMALHLKPTKVVLGKESYVSLPSEPQSSVQALLRQIGTVESWEASSVVSPTQVKATARFNNSEDARMAVKKLDGKTLSILGNSKLFVRPLVSLKFNVLIDMYNAIQGDFDDLKSQIWDSGHVHFKAYPATDSSQKTVVVRLYGEDAKPVAKAKSALEKILAGSAAKGEVRIWNDFFATSAGFSYLKEISRKHMGFIYRDMRKHQLSLYGSAKSKDGMQTALSEKLGDLSRSTHIIPLSAEDLKNALEGGFRRIITRLGKQKASLDVTRRPQTITVIGSENDLALARSLLYENNATDVDNLELSGPTNAPDCAVCWTEAEDPFQTRCGHHYCSSCFAGQCASANECDIPIHCLGDSGDCSEILDLSELKSVLTPPAFEKLLEDSLATHVRTHPKLFQYCPTPDCQQVYRVSTDGSVVDCPACLTPICTSCQTISHDDLTCAEYKDLASEGSKAFNKWKSENDVRDCPSCKASIEKAYGCNHMECRNCNTHICWFCMENFAQGPECYGHMKKVHGSFQ